MFRLLSPLFGLSLLLMAVGGGAAWYLHRLNIQISQALDRELTAVFASEELVLAIRDTRIDLERFAVTTDQAHLNSALANQEIVQRFIDDIRAVPAIDTRLSHHLHQSQAGFFTQLRSQSPEMTPQRALMLRDELNETLLMPARQLLEENRRRAAQESVRNQRIADRIGLVLLVLGTCGAAAGLLSGYSIAQTLGRSLDQLGGSVRTMAVSLSDEHQPGDPHPQPDFLQLSETMQRLATRAADTVQELQQSRQAAQRSGQLAAMGQLAAGLAHELRNPLTSIKLLVQSARERANRLTDRELDVLEEEIERLEKLLQSFLDFARPSKPQQCEVEIVSLVRETVEFARPRCRRQGVDLQFRPCASAVVHGDPQQLRQVVLNLLLNALQVQPQEGWIEVTMSLDSARRPSGVLIRVADCGPGLPTGEAEQIFDPFFSTMETGIGLGLTISQRIVRSHHGTIEAANREDCGAEFLVRLPLKAGVPISQDTAQAGSVPTPSPLNLAARHADAVDY